MKPTKIFEPLLKYDPGFLLDYAKIKSDFSSDTLESDCWQVIQRIARFMKFAEWITSDELGKELEKDETN